MRLMVRAMGFLNQPPMQVVCRNNKRSSALAAISNCMLLRNYFNLDHYVHEIEELEGQNTNEKEELGVQNAKEIDEFSLCQLISRYTMDYFRFCMPFTVEVKSILLEYFNIIKVLDNGIKVYPRPDSIAAFKKTRTFELFGTLGIQLLHSDGFNEQVISALKGQLEEHQLAILYSNGEFHTICKHNDTVFMLIEDEALHLSNPSASWVTVVTQREILVDDDFSLTRACLNTEMHKCSSIRCSKKFFTSICCERHHYAHQEAYRADMNTWNKETFATYWDVICPEKVSSILSDTDNTVKQMHDGSSICSIISNWVLSSEYHLATRDVKDAARKLNILMKANTKPSSNELLDILKVASEDTFMSTNLLKRRFLPAEADKSDNMLRSMLAYFSLSVEETLFQEWYDMREKEVKDLEEQLVKEHVPSEEYFPTFVATKTLVRLFTLFSGVKVVGLTRIGRRIAKRLLKFILEAHKAGNCWHGQWSILDIRVRDGGLTLVIDKMTGNATTDGMVADLQKFIKVIAPYYQMEGDQGPAYFHEFSDDAMGLPDRSSDKFDDFQKFLSYHLAFMPPLARSCLFDRLFMICDAIREERGDHGYKELCNMSAENWIDIRHTDPYNAVFFYDVTKPCPYNENYWDLHRFVWNFLNHVLNYTKVNGVQVIEDITVLDLMLAHDLAHVISKLLHHLFFVSEKKERFKSAWIAFRTSDA